MDVVYTWVDDTFEGYREALSAHARDDHDRNPNRTRDNLALLKYSLRSLERFAPWAARVFVVTMRPQAPSWLDPSRVTLVHHDEIFEARHLPTFNSFAIVSRLAAIPGVSSRFLYMEDDRLFLAPTTECDLFSSDGRHLLYLSEARTPDASHRTDESLSPWNRGLAEANALLDERYGRRDRLSVNGAPLVITKDSFAAFEHEFAGALERTRSSRFRGAGNVPPEHLYPWWLHHEGKATLTHVADAAPHLGYVGLENWPLWNAFYLRRLSRRSPKFACLNDNFGARPREGAVRAARRFLDRTFPTPSRFERR